MKLNITKKNPISDAGKFVFLLLLLLLISTGLFALSLDSYSRPSSIDTNREKYYSRTVVERDLGIGDRDNPFGGGLRSGGDGFDDDGGHDTDHNSENGTDAPIGDALGVIIFFSLLYGGYKKHRDARPCVSTKILL
jgi:hypothetical protein